MNDDDPDYGPGVAVHRAARAGYHGLVADVSVDGRDVGLVHISGSTPPTEATELWTADSVTGRPNRFLTEWEAIVATVANARRHEP